MFIKNIIVIMVVVMSMLVITTVSRPMNNTEEVPRSKVICEDDCGNGVCVSVSPDHDHPSPTCICVTPYIHTERDNCAYKARSKLVAFLLSFFLGNLGVDWFYLSFGTASYVFGGIFKIILLLVLPIFGKVLVASGEGVPAVAGCCVCILPATLWYFIDWIRILTNSFPDGNGMPLYEDM